MGRFLTDQKARKELIAQPPFEQRDDLRHRTVLQVAKLSTETGDELCILRNVSAGGLRADVYCDLAVDDPVEFELKTGRRISGRIAWAEGNAVGVQFDRKVPILSYLAHQAIHELGRRVRAPRIQIGERAALRTADREFDVEIVDASQAGMRIRTDRLLIPGSTCEIVAGGLGERGALIRWCHDGQAGLELKRPLSFADFAQWRKRGRGPMVAAH